MPYRWRAGCNMPRPLQSTARAGSAGIARRDGVTRDRPEILIRTHFDDSGRGPLPRPNRGKLHLRLPVTAGRPPSGLVAFAPATDVRITPRHDARCGEFLSTEPSRSA